MSNIQTVDHVNSEADNIRAAIQEDAAQQLLKFAKGTYSKKEEEVPVGTEFVAYCRMWVKAWIKFIDKKIVEKKLYKVALGERRPPREELDDTQKMNTEYDPWSDQYFLPMENLATGEVVIFVTSTYGGREAVRNLCDEYQKRTRAGQFGQPIVQLAVGKWKSKKFGEQPCPTFEIVGWDDKQADMNASEVSIAAALPVTAKPRDDMDDEIPF